MRHLAKLLAFALAWLLCASLIFPLEADAAVFGVSADRAEGSIDEEITWTVAGEDWKPSHECAYFLYRDAELIAYEPLSSVKSFRYTPSSGGLYALTALISDGSNIATCAANGVTVKNEPLSILSVSANRSQVSVGSYATWTVEIAGGSGNVHYGFFLYRDGNLIGYQDEPDSQYANWFTQLLDKPGVYTVQAWVGNSSEKAKMMSEPITATDASPDPIAITGITVSEPQSYVGEPITWTAHATGGEGDVAFSFFLYKDGELISLEPNGNSNVYCYTPAASGIYSVSAHAGSGLNYANLMSEGVPVTYQPGVRLTGVSHDKNRAVRGESITWTAYAEDASGDVSYSFTLFRDGAIVLHAETGGSPSFTYAPSETGSYEVTAYAKDDVRSTSAPSAEVKVVESVLAVDFVSADTVTGRVGTPVTWTVKVAGANQPRFIYFVYHGAELVQASEATDDSFFTYTPDAYGAMPYRLKGVVSDENQTLAFESDALMVTAEGYPRILKVVSSTEVTYPGQLITWQVHVGDFEKAGGISYVLYGDKTGLADQSGWVDQLVYAFAPTEVDTYHLEINLMSDPWIFGIECDTVRVVEPVLYDIAPIQDFSRFDYLSPSANPTPQPTLSNMDLDFEPRKLPTSAPTTRPPMAPEKPKKTDTPTLSPNLVMPDFNKPKIRLP